MAFYPFDTLSSSNDEARDPRYAEGDWIGVEHQTAGRGQRGHAWSSHAGEDITGSLVLEPQFLPVREQFSISQAVALGVVDLLARYGIAAEIKWTNDIYVAGRKVAGILIEHALAGTNLSRTIVGIGLNVNRTAFDPELPNPTSMALLTGRSFDREELLERLHGALMARYEALREGGAEALRCDYHAHLYRLNREQRFRLPSGEEFLGKIRGVEADGTLWVEHPDGHKEGYLFREIEFVIAGRDRQNSDLGG